MDIQFRAIGPGEYDAMVKAFGLAFGFDPPEEDHLEPLLRFDRTVCGFDGDEIVATAGAHTLDMTVPGGTLPCGGTTLIAVMPSHRRRGILREMMRRHLDDVRGHEEPIAALWASDSAIYGRFGYGQASLGYDLTFDRDHVSFHRLAAQPSPVRVISAEEAASLLPPVYETIRTAIPGFLRRSPEWWEHRRLADPPDRRHGATAYRYGIIDGPGGIDGYVQYRVKSGWEEGHGAGEVMVRDLLGATPEAWSGLWSYVLNHDLISKITTEDRSGSDPVFDLLAGPRRVEARRGDNLWVRIMDVPRALSGRSYADEIDTVFEVRDPMGDCDGRYRLIASREGAECVPTDDEAGISLDLEDLGSCFMGWSRFRALSASGRVTGDPEVLRIADHAFTWDPQPWCPEVF